MKPGDELPDGTWLCGFVVVASDRGVGSGGGKGDGGFDRFPPADPITIKNLRATLTGKFSGGANSSAYREFIPPATGSQAS